MNTAIIVAAGAGTRFGGEIPKQFIEILGKPVILHTLEKFESCTAVDEIVLVLSEGREHEAAIRDFGSSIPKLRKIVPGGATRAESVKNGLDVVNPATEIVAVHDGARPLVHESEIDRTIARARETGAACLVGKVTDTIKSVRGGEIAGTLDREKLRKALTPQAFRTGVLRRAYETADALGSATDECYLVEKLGHPIAFVEGSSRNIKITFPDDVLFAEAVLQASPDRIAAVS